MASAWSSFWNPQRVYSCSPVAIGTREEWRIAANASVHVIAAQSPYVCPMAETLLLALPSKQQFYQQAMMPERGQIALPTAPGLGYALDDAKIEARTPIAV